MSKDKKHLYIIGSIIIAVVVVFVLVVYSMLSKANTSIIVLADTAEQSCGWTYEKLTDGVVTSAEPEFSDEYGTFIKGGHADAVKITMVMTDFDRNTPCFEMNIATSDILGVEMFVEGEITYSSFSGGERNKEGYLILDKNNLPDTSLEERGGIQVRVSLPEDYVGKTVSIITYYSKDAEILYPVYPWVCNYDTDSAPAAVYSVIPVAVMTLCAILAILTVIIFVLDFSNGKVNMKILLLTLFFMLLFIDKAYISFPGTYSILIKYMDLSFLWYVYTAPLLMYIALSLTGWRKYILSGLTAIWFLYEVTQMFITQYSGEYGMIGANGLIELLLFAAALVLVTVELLLQRKNSIKINKFYIITCVIVIVFCLFFELRTWNGDIMSYISDIITDANEGGYIIVVDLISNIFAVMAVIILVIEFIKRTLNTHKLITVLEERSRLTMESYNRMVESENATGAVRHEMRHHILALSGMIKNNDIKGIQEYLTSLEYQLDNLPTGRYSQNIMVNILAGTYLDRAKNNGVKVKYHFNIPQKIPIADSDLCVFLTNLLENALKACEKTEPEIEKYINVNIGLNGNFLFIGCENSYSEQTDKKDKRHSYGLKNMESIAKKYNGVLKIEKKASSFSVMSTLCLTKNFGEEDMSL